MRDHAHSLPKNVRKLALKTALSAKQAEGKLVILDAATAKSHKTKEMAKTLETLGLISALIIDGTPDVNFTRAVRNIKHIDVLPEKGINVYDILRRDTLVLTKEAVAQLESSPEMTAAKKKEKKAVQLTEGLYEAVRFPVITEKGDDGHAVQPVHVPRSGLDRTRRRSATQSKPCSR